MHQRNDVNLLAFLEPAAEPAREDDGSLDGIRAITPAERLARESSRLAEIARLASGTKRGRRINGKPTNITRLSDGKFFSFPSRGDACRFVGVNQSNLIAALKRKGREHAGFIW